jgi:hypothetical protein
MMQKKKTGIAFFELSTSLFATFITLKLTNTGVIGGWSWWWVTAPLWGCFVFNLSVRITMEINEEK